MQGSGHLTQAERLARVLRRHNIRVLIVHGSSDVLVPAANSRRLVSLLPNSEVNRPTCCGPLAMLRPQQQQGSWPLISLLQGSQDAPRHALQS